MIVAYIDGHRDRFGVEPICRVLSEHGMKIAPSTYYAALKAPVSPAALADAYHVSALIDLSVAFDGVDQVDRTGVHRAGMLPLPNRFSRR